MIFMIKRSEKLAFMQVEDGGEAKLVRMTGFTEFSVSKNPKEYSRKYIDEDMERNDVVSYSPSISFNFDTDPDNLVHKALCNVADRELLGGDAQCVIVIADISAKDSDGVCPAVKRSFIVIPSGEGDDKDTYTVSGSLKASGDKIFGTATSVDDFKTITFTEG